MKTKLRGNEVASLIEMFKTIAFASADRPIDQTPPKKPFVPQNYGPLLDFHVVDPHHAAMDKRLVNWGRACFSGGGSSATGVFKFVKPSQPWDATETAVPVDHRDALKIAQGVARLPEPHAKALQWLYVLKTPPRRGCQICATTMQGLDRLIKDGRTMLINRKV